MNRLVTSMMLLLSAVFNPLLAAAGAADESPEVVAARKARDQADVETLRVATDKLGDEAARTKSFNAYVRLALFDHWRVEAAHGRNDEKLVKQAAEAGVAAAEKALALSPNSSQAHRLLGELLSDMIPYVFAGGMRYGPRSTREIEKALELDPKDPDAYIARAVNYFYTPAAFGGNRDKAAEMLKKAIELAPASDTAHIWLAQVELAAGRREQALAEINAARRLNPEREFARSVLNRISSGKGK